MLVHDFQVIGSRLFSIRKRLGLTQAEVAEAAGVSDRTYADIERGTVNMRIDTILRICDVMHVTTDEIFAAQDTPFAIKEEEILSRLRACTPAQRDTALKLLSVYLDSLE